MKNKGAVVIGKKLLIKKANSTMFIAVILASIIVSFSVVFLNFIWGNKVHNDHVLSEKNRAKDTLEQNVDNIQDLKDNFKLLDNSKEINARIILDALPSKYDYPALATTVENLVKKSTPPVALLSFESDDKSAEAPDTATQPSPVEAMFTVKVGGTYKNVQKFVKRMHRTIRPMKVVNANFSGTNKEMEATFEVITYYQPAQDLTIETRTVE